MDFQPTSSIREQAASLDTANAAILNQAKGFGRVAELVRSLIPGSGKERAKYHAGLARK
jgi:hypothetical protein